MPSHWLSILPSLLLLLPQLSIAAAQATIPTLSVSCVDDASIIPSHVFSSDSNKVYSQFCPNTINNHNTLRWMYDVFGNLNGNDPPSRSKIKRLAYGVFGKRDDGPEQFTNWQFELNWAPSEDTGAECYLDCPSAFAVLAATPQCSQKGEGGKLMSVSGQIQVGCGMYGYTVRGIAIS